MGGWCPFLYIPKKSLCQLNSVHLIYFSIYRTQPSPTLPWLPQPMQAYLLSVMRKLQSASVGSAHACTDSAHSGVVTNVIYSTFATCLHQHKGLVLAQRALRIALTVSDWTDHSPRTGPLVAASHENYVLPPSPVIGSSEYQLQWEERHVNLSSACGHPRSSLLRSRILDQMSLDQAWSCRAFLMFFIW